jgi:hypothetical protein
MKKLFLVLALLVLGSIWTQGAFAACSTDTDRFDTHGWCIDHYGVFTPKAIATDSQQISAQGGVMSPVLYVAGPYSTYSTLSAQQSGSVIIDMGGATGLTADTVTGRGGEYILPTAASGESFTFTVGSNSTITIDTLTTSDSIMYKLTTSGDGLKNTSKASGDSITLVSGGSTNWVVTDVVGTWADTGAARIH